MKLQRVATMFAFVGLLYLISFSQIVSAKLFYERPGVSPAEIFRARGFLAQEDYVISEGGYVLRVTRATNPLILNGKVGGLPNRDPLLFVHGIVEDDSIYVIRSEGAKPRDFSNLDLSSSDPNVNRTVLRDPSSRNLPMLALNFGHTVYILSRRGFYGSQQRLGDRNTINPRTQFKFSLLPNLGPLSTAPSAFISYGNAISQMRFALNTNFWNFSFDEQIAYDLPKVIDYVLEQTGKQKLSLVSHSSGGILTLGSMAIYPELEQKVSSQILWAQCINVGHGDMFMALAPFEGFFNVYIGPVPPGYMTNQIQAYIGVFCRNKLLQKTFCAAAADLALGPSGRKEPLKPEFVNALMNPTASHEIAQNLQALRTNGMMHMYDWGTEGNQVLYNNTSPPLYDLSKIKFRKMSFYSSATDTLVTKGDVEATIKMLGAPVNYHLITATFNHQGYFYHDQNNELAILPSLKEIQMFTSMS